MSGDGVSIDPDDVAVLSGLVLKLGEYAQDFVDAYDFGVDRSVIDRHIASTRRHVQRLAGNGGPYTSLRPSGLDASTTRQGAGDTWDYGQTLRFAAGAAMISQRYMHHMTPEDLRRSVTAKVLYKCQTGILDDLVDKERHTYIEAKDLYHHVLSSMTDPDFDLNAFRRRLVSLMRQEQLHLSDLVTGIVRRFNALYNESPHGHELFHQMEVLDQRVILGQALTMFQKEGSLDLHKIRRLARQFYAPAPDLLWHDRMANYISGGTRYNLIDLSFVDGGPEWENMDHFLEGWYYFDVVIVYLNNIVNVYSDLQDGILNLSLIAMRDDSTERTTTEGYDPSLSPNDYGGHLRRLAEFIDRGLQNLQAFGDDVDLYYPFITVMMPIVMMADWIGRRDDLVAAFMREVAPFIRTAVDRAPLAGLEVAAPVSSAPIGTHRVGGGWEAS